jgi:hypothetical protein
MPSPEIEEFARILVRHMRDVAIQSCDAALMQDCKPRPSPLAKRR